MSSPDFLLIGAMKCGTTSLFEYICQHPAVLRPRFKELRYYSKHRYSSWTLENYLEQFPEKPPGFITGEATPFYLRHKHAPKWVASDFPDIKLIAVLRNPVERAYSHYQQRFRKGKEEKGFLEVIKIEYDMMKETLHRDSKDPSFKREFPIYYSYLSRGLYYDQLTNWLLSFHKKQLHVLFTEELLESTENELVKIYKHLEIAPTKFHKGMLKNKGNYLQMPDEARQWLENYYFQHNKNLSLWLERKLPW